MREKKVVEILTAIVIPLLILFLISAGLGMILWQDCQSQNDNSSLNIDSLFEIFGNCSPGRSKESQLKLSSTTINNNIVDLKTSNQSLTSTTPELQTTPNTLRNLRASSIQKQSETLRSLAKKRDVSPYLHSTPPTSRTASSLHSRSRTGSPCPSTICGE